MSELVAITLPREEADALRAVLHTYKRLAETLTHAEKTARLRGDDASAEEVLALVSDLVCNAHTIAAVALRSLYAPLWRLS